MPKNLYTLGAPVMITSGALLRDSKRDRALVRLKFRSLDRRELQALTVELTPRDQDGALLGTPVQCTYRDLEVQRGQRFGRNFYVVLPDPETRQFDVLVTEAVFSDGSKWEDTGCQWEPLELPEDLATFLGSQELAAEYQDLYGADCAYAPTRRGDLWYCTCGVLNRSDETECIRCGRTFQEPDGPWRQELEDHRQQRLEQQRQSEQFRQARRERALRLRKPVAIAAAAILFLAAAGIGLHLHLNNLRRAEAARQEQYQEGITLLEAGAYDEAVRIFGALGDYQDSGEQLSRAQAALEEEDRQARYNDALFLMEQGQLPEAYELFQSLGDFKDAAAYQLRHQSRLEQLRVTRPDYDYTLDYTYDDFGRLHSTVSYQYFTGETYFAYREDGLLTYSWNQRGWQGRVGEGYLSTVECYYNEQGDPYYQRTTYYAPVAEEDEAPSEEPESEDGDGSPDEAATEEQEEPEDLEEESEEESSEAPEPEAEPEAPEVPVALSRVEITTFEYTYNPDGTKAGEISTVDGEQSWYRLDYDYEYAGEQLDRVVTSLRPAEGGDVWAQWETTYTYDQLGNIASYETVQTQGGAESGVTETGRYTYSTTYTLEKS